MGAKDIIGHAISASAGSLPSKIKASQTSSCGLQKDTWKQTRDLWQMQCERDRVLLRPLKPVTAQSWYEVKPGLAMPPSV